MKRNNLWKKKASLFIASQGITLFGSSVVQLAMVWYVTLKTSSGIWLTVLTLASFIPQMLISFLAGAWADRYNKKKMIIIADTIIAVTTLFLAIFLLKEKAGNIGLYAIVIVSIIRGVGTGIQTPTVNAMISELVPEDKLMKFNGINSSIQTAIQFASPLVAGAILVFGAISNILLIDVVTAIIGVGILVFIKTTRKSATRNTEKQVITKEIKEGIKFAISDKLIGKLLLIYGIFIFLSVPSSFMCPLLITRNFGSEYIYLSINEAVGFAGMFLAGLLLGIWGGFKNRNKTLTIGLVLYAVFSISLAISSQFWIFAIVMFLLSFSIPIVQTTTMTLLQEKVAMEMQGRIFSLLNAIFSGLMPLGMVLFGVLADVVPIDFLIIPTGTIILIMAIFIPILKQFYKSGIKQEQ